MANGTSFTTDDTFFSDISIALPGRLYSINTNTFELRNKTVDTHISNIDCTISEPLDVKKQRNLLHETFQKHLVATSTLPIASTLSSGVDSSSIAFFLSEVKPESHTALLHTDELKTKYQKT